MSTSPTAAPWKLWNGYGPLPNGKWAVARIGPDSYDASIAGAEGHDIVGQKDVLEYIVRCVNSHEALVGALKALINDLDGWSHYDQRFLEPAKAALKAAEEEA